MNKLVTVIIVALASRALAGPPDPHPLTPEQMQREYAQRARNFDASQAAGKGAQSGVTTGITWTRWGIGAVQTWQELVQAFHGLTSFDATCIDASAAGAPPVPSSCSESEQTCGQCYRDAYRELGEARLKLERLRCVYQATKRVADKAIAFGDTSSGIHAVVGLEWQTQKKRILESVNQLNHSYDAKLGEFLPRLKSSLEHVGQCEQQFMHEPDWYTRFGFIYFTFMNDRYKRKD
ncbi:MAG TPA: hypothetical protein VIV40_26870 [Kofleriaceae bacterium]